MPSMHRYISCCVVGRVRVKLSREVHFNMVPAARLGCSMNEVCPQVERVLWFGLFFFRGRAPAIDQPQRIG